MRGRFVSIVGGFTISLIVFSQLIATFAKADFASPNQGQGSSLIYLGCVDPWEGQYTTFHGPNGPKYNTSYTPAICSEGCLKSSSQMQLSFLKGAQCDCAPIYEFNSTWIEDSHCNVPCPVKDFKPGEENPGDEYCGGNRGYSVYCAPGLNDCNNVRPSSSSQPMQNFDVVQSAEGPSNLKVLGMGMNDPCAICTDPNHRSKPYFHPDFDYFPANSPASCVEFCATSVNYVTSYPNSSYHVRLPTKYALLTWGRVWNSDPDWIQLPICRCLNQDLRGYFTSVDSSHCNMSCPGRLEEMCGGREEDEGSYSTIYCVDEEDENCHR